MIPDALDMFHRRDRQQAQEEKRLPLCEWCNEYIHDEDYYDIEGKILCPECLDIYFKKKTEDYIDG